VKHLGNIKLIHGNEIEVVDVVIGGSPCLTGSLNCRSSSRTRGRAVGTIYGTNEDSKGDAR
jgi:site-specific DNA-cytosine methylase